MLTTGAAAVLRPPLHLDRTPTGAPRQTPAPAGPARLLVVDDEPAIRRALARCLGARGYHVDTAEGGEAALRALATRDYALVLCDVRMPGMSGLDLVPRALVADPDLAIVMLTSNGDAASATAALTRGAVDYLTKPVELPTLESAVERALQQRALVVERRTSERRLRADMAWRTAELEREKQTLHDVSTSVVDALVNAMEAKDAYQSGHSRRVAELATAMAEELGLRPDIVECVRVAARLKDVGRIGVRESVLNKPGTLSEDELQHVRDHARLSVEILSPLKHLGPALQFVQDHHEHWDGLGYPQGLAGESISIGGRILAAADAYEAITSRRAYRAALAPLRAVELLESLVGTLLDPRVFEALRIVIARREASLELAS